MNGKINTSNYEAFVLDYLEGNLSAEDFALLEAFIAMHPGLEIDLEDKRLVSLEPEAIRYTDKKQLKKHAPFISGERFIAYIENTASAEERAVIESAAMADAAVKKELELYKRTILKADTSVIFANKALLKRGPKVIRFAPVYLSAAAALILAFGLWFLPGNSFEQDFKGHSLSYVTTHAQFSQINSNSVNPITVNSINSIRKANNGINVNNPLASAIRKTGNKKEEAVKDSLTNSAVAGHNPEKISPKQQQPATVKDTVQTMIAAASKEIRPVFMVATGSDDEEATPVQTEKSGFWAKAGRIFRNLNKLGVKKVNAVETFDRKEEQYVLSLGNFSIRKNKFNQ